MKKGNEYFLCRLCNEEHQEPIKHIHNGILWSTPISHGIDKNGL